MERNVKERNEMIMEWHGKGKTCEGKESEGKTSERKA
jgi:hypothetical protein